MGALFEDFPQREKKRLPAGAGRDGSGSGIVRKPFRRSPVPLILVSPSQDGYGDKLTSK